MRSLSRIALTVSLAALLAGPASAQQRQPRQGGGRMGQGGLAGLLQNESVQKELKIDKDQAGKVAEAVKQVRDAHRDDFAKLRDASQEERRAKMQELTRTVSEETLKAVGTILKPEQVKRLKQIEIQQAGVNAFLRSDVQKALNLTDEQKQKIKAIAEESAQETRALFGGRGQGGQGGQRGVDREKITAMRKQAMDKAAAVLTDDQKKTWKDLTGDPFQVQFNRRRADQ